MAGKSLRLLTGMVHFVGIGGIGMSGIAEIIHSLGGQVQGSDCNSNYNTSRLENLGIKIFYEHAPINVHNAEYVVVSTAIKPNNPEVMEALKLHIPVIKRAEMLAQIMRFMDSIAISGSHGKTTTTAMVACLFEAAKLHPTVINGGIINHKLTNAYIGQGNYLIAEADESDATFLHIPANVAVITNIDAEHLDFYNDFNSLILAFRQFITNLPFYGFAVVCLDDPIVRQVTSTITERKVISYGIESSDANVCAFNVICSAESSTFDVKIQLPKMRDSFTIRGVNLPAPGYHNVLNSLAALTIAAELDFGPKVLQNGFKSFKGVKRRFTKVGEHRGASIIDDYAHHPKEVIATLSIAKIITEEKGGRILAVFQPHRYSRVQSLLEEFGQCFRDAYKVYCLEIYSAGEEPLPGITSQAIITKVNSFMPAIEAEYIESIAHLASRLDDIIQPGDLVICMGAGSITYWAANLTNALQQVDRS